MDNEVAAARAKLAARFGKVQLGGKGTLLTLAFAAHPAHALTQSDLTRFARCRYSEKTPEEDSPVCPAGRQ